jgi:hypothetical protein
MRRITFTPPFLTTKTPGHQDEQLKQFGFYFILSSAPFVLLWFSSSTHELSTYCATDQKPKVEGAEHALSDGLAYTFVTGVYESRAESFTVQNRVPPVIRAESVFSDSICPKFSTDSFENRNQ